MSFLSKMRGRKDVAGAFSHEIPAEERLLDDCVVDGKHHCTGDDYKDGNAKTEGERCIMQRRCTARPGVENPPFTHFLGRAKRPTQ